MIMDIELFRNLFPKAEEKTLRDYHNILPYYMGVYGIETRRQQANFLANLYHESGGLRVFRENLNYSTEALIRKFGRHRISIEEANRYGRGNGRPADQRMLARILYGGAFGRRYLGNLTPEHAENYIGMGPIQLTGLSNYSRFGKHIGDEKFILDNPSVVMNAQYGAWSSCWFWKDKRLNELSEAGEIHRVRKLVSGGTFGMDQTIMKYEQNLILLS
jgi:putative chitinase